ncbi:MAG TPA: SCO family protein [Pirellulales bacterium]|nr:SCO family protein [Pirellulales bacterium]
MKYLEKLPLALTTVMLLLAVPYLLVKTGVWQPALSVASDASAALPMRDPDELPVICELADFAMTNQLGQTIRRDDLLGQVWVADVIFTRCPGPCAMMTTRMADLQASIPKEWPVKFVSLTADADYDTPEVLRRYAEEYQADSQRWNFLHSTKTGIVDLAVRNLKLVVLDKEQERQSAHDLFIHSTTLALVDKHGRLRGAFESVPMIVSDDADFADVQPAPLDDWQTTLKPRLLKAVEQLIVED